MSEQDAGELADRLEDEADRMQRESEDLQGEVRRTGEDWQRKQATESVPGAQPEQPEERSPQERSGEDEDEDPAHESPAGGEGAPS